MKKLRFAFFTLGLAVDPETHIEKQSIGGSESALLYLSRELVKLGHDVEVFCNLKNKKPVTVNNVKFIPADQFEKVVNSQVNYDVIVSMRFHDRIAHLFHKMNASMILFWNHDMPVPDMETNVSYMMFPDKIILLSEFHFWEYEKYLPFLERDKSIFMSKNGVDLEVTDAFYEARQDNLDKIYDGNPIFLYGSRPERGLRNLLQNIFPKIRKEIPNAELWVTSYSFDPKDVSPYYHETYRQVELAKLISPGVKFIEGGLDKEGWYTAIANANAILYPTDFPEISCIAAIEAQAIGTPIITTDKYALSETVGPSTYKIGGIEDTLSEEYCDAFVEKVLFLEEFDEVRNKAVEEGYNYVKDNYGWDTIAQEWVDEVLEFFQDRYDKNKLQIFNSFYEKNDYVCAAKVLDDMPDSEATKPELVDKMLKYRIFSNTTQGVKEPLTFLEEVKLTRYDVMVEHSHDEGARKATSILDIGCGYGECITQFAKAYPDADLYMGIDLDTSYAKEYTNRFLPEDLKKKMKFNDVNIYDLMKGKAKLDEKYDLVVLGEVLEHFEETTELLALCQNLCTSGGKIVISVPTGFWEDQHHRQCYNYTDLMTVLAEKDNVKTTHLSTYDNERGKPRGNWVLSFDYSPSKAKLFDIPYQVKVLRERPLETICICMIVKDEEENIIKCLNSVKHLADRIKIYDTGSTDRTMELVTQWAADTSKIPLDYELGEWTDSFEDARNRSINGVEEDWILYIDADETYYGSNKLWKWIQSPYMMGYSLTQRQVSLDMESTEEYPCRLFRNLPEIEFYGIVHEQPAFGSNVPTKPQINLPDVVLLHVGYPTEGVRRYKSAHRNLPLLLKDRLKYPNRKVGLILIMRDLVNIARWEVQANQGFVTEKSVKYYLDALDIFNKHFKYEQDVTTFDPANKIYSQAMSELASLGVPVGNEGNLPTEIILSIKGGVSGIQNPESLSTYKFWVQDKAELEGRIQEKVDTLWNIVDTSVDRLLDPVCLKKESLPEFKIEEKYYKNTKPMTIITPKETPLLDMVKKTKTSDKFHKKFVGK